MLEEDSLVAVCAAVAGCSIDQQTCCQAGAGICCWTGSAGGPGVRVQALGICVCVLQVLGVQWAPGGTGDTRGTVEPGYRHRTRATEHQGVSRGSIVQRTQ